MTGHAPTPEPAPASRRPLIDPATSRRRMVVVIVLMLFAFGAVVGWRDTLRTRWWAYRVDTADDPADRLHYLQLLAGAREAALPVARRWLQAPDAATRSQAMPLLAASTAPEAVVLLRDAVDDDDADLRRSALLALALRGDALSTKQLVQLADHHYPDVALLAVNRLAASPDTVAGRWVALLATNHPIAAIRAEAIAGLATRQEAEVIEALISCLLDDAVVEVEIETERLARDTLAAVGGQGATTSGVTAPRSPTGAPATLTNGQRAARSLQALTGEDFGMLEAGGRVEQQQAIRRWRDWYDAQDGAGPGSD